MDRVLLGSRECRQAGCLGISRLVPTSVYWLVKGIDARKWNLATFVETISVDGRVIVTIGKQGYANGNNKQTNQCGHIAVSDRIFLLLCWSRPRGERDEVYGR